MFHLNILLLLHILIFFTAEASNNNNDNNNNNTNLKCPRNYKYHKRTNKCYWVSETLHFHHECQKAVCDTSKNASLATLTNENIYFLTNLIQTTGGNNFVNVGLFKDPTDNYWHWMNQKDDSDNKGKNETTPFKIRLVPVHYPGNCIERQNCGVLKMDSKQIKDRVCSKEQFDRSKYGVLNNLYLDEASALPCLCVYPSKLSDHYEEHEARLYSQCSGDTMLLYKFIQDIANYQTLSFVACILLILACSISFLSYICYRYIHNTKKIDILSPRNKEKVYKKQQKLYLYNMIPMFSSIVIFPLFLKVPYYDKLIESKSQYLLNKFVQYLFRISMSMFMLESICHCVPSIYVGDNASLIFLMIIGGPYLLCILAHIRLCDFLVDHPRHLYQVISELVKSGDFNQLQSTHKKTIIKIICVEIFLIAFSVQALGGKVDILWGPMPMGWLVSFPVLSVYMMVLHIISMGHSNHIIKIEREFGHQVKTYYFQKKQQQQKQNYNNRLTFFSDDEDEEEDKSNITKEKTKIEDEINTYLKEEKKDNHQRTSIANSKKHHNYVYNNEINIDTENTESTTIEKSKSISISDISDNNYSNDKEYRNQMILDNMFHNHFKLMQQTKEKIGILKVGIFVGIGCLLISCFYMFLSDGMEPAWLPLIIVCMYLTTSYIGILAIVGNQYLNFLQKLKSHSFGLMSKSIFNSPNYLFQLHVTELKRHSFVLFNRAVTSQTITQVSLTIIGGMVILLLPSLLPSF